MMTRIDVCCEALGAFDPHRLGDVVQRQSLPLERLFDGAGGYHPEALARPAEMRAALAQIPLSPEAQGDLLADLLERAAAARTAYLELHLDPLAHGRCALSMWCDHLSALQERAEVIANSGGPQLRLVLSAAREGDPAQAEIAAHFAAETAGGLVAGFAVIGDPMVGDLDHFARAFAQAREAGLALGVTASAQDGAAGIREALSITNGLRLYAPRYLPSDPALCEELAERGTKIVLPVQARVTVTAVVAQGFAKAVEIFEARGLSPAFGTGGAKIDGLALADLEEVLHRHLDWDAAEWARSYATALDAAFCDVNTKELIAKKLECL